MSHVRGEYFKFLLIFELRISTIDFDKIRALCRGFYVIFLVFFFFNVFEVKPKNDHSLEYRDCTQFAVGKTSSATLKIRALLLIEFLSTYKKNKK